MLYVCMYVRMHVMNEHFLQWRDAFNNTEKAAVAVVVVVTSKGLVHVNDVKKKEER